MKLEIKYSKALLKLTVLLQAGEEDGFLRKGIGIWVLEGKFQKLGLSLEKPCPSKHILPLFIATGSSS